MWKWLKNKKATSPVTVVTALVVAMLIVPIVAAACAGALTFTFIAFEHVSLTNFVWGPNNAYCQVTVENTGTANLSILAVRINGAVPKSVDPSLMSPCALDKDASVVFTLTSADGFVHGGSYQFTVITTKGNSFSLSVKAAP
jgi:hypothetical protein